MKNNSLPFGEYVKQRREQLGKTMRAFAAEVEISPAYLCDIENGNRKAPERFLENSLRRWKSRIQRILTLFMTLRASARTVSTVTLIHTSTRCRRREWLCEQLKTAILRMRTGRSLLKL